MKYIMYGSILLAASLYYNINFIQVVFWKVKKLVSGSKLQQNSHVIVIASFQSTPLQLV